MRDERGVVLIQVAIAVVALFGFSALVIDYGVLLVARSQAQNAADAGALAAATSLAFDTMTYDETGSGTAEESARAIAATIPVWDAPGEVEALICDTESADGNPSGSICPQIKGFPPLSTPGRMYFGATVRVFRDGETGPALPTYFARIFGVNSQRVKAQATANVVPANTSTCVWPVAIPDFLPPVPNETYIAHQYPNEPLLTMADVYRGPPTFLAGALSAYGEDPTGIVVSMFDSPSDSLVFEPVRFVGLLGEGLGSPTPMDPWQPVQDPFNGPGGRLIAVQIPRKGGGGFSENLDSCNQVAVHIGDTLAVETSATFAQVTDAASRRIGKDGGAYWDDSTRRIRGSCAANPPCLDTVEGLNSAISPRLVLLPVFDPDLYDETRGSSPTIKVVNFVGLFLDPGTGEVVGNLATYPGSADPAHPFVLLDNSPLRTVLLAR